MSKQFQQARHNPHKFKLKFISLSQIYQLFSVQQQQNDVQSPEKMSINLDEITTQQINLDILQYKYHHIKNIQTRFPQIIGKQSLFLFCPKIFPKNLAKNWQIYTIHDSQYITNKNNEKWYPIFYNPYHYEDYYNQNLSLITLIFEDKDKYYGFIGYIPRNYSLYKIIKILAKFFNIYLDKFITLCITNINQAYNLSDKLQSQQLTIEDCVGQCIKITNNVQQQESSMQQIDTFLIGQVDKIAKQIEQIDELYVNQGQYNGFIEQLLEEYNLRSNYEQESNMFKYKQDGRQEIIKFEVNNKNKRYINYYRNTEEQQKKQYLVNRIKTQLMDQKNDQQISQLKNYAKYKINHDLIGLPNLNNQIQKLLYEELQNIIEKV